MAAVDEYRELDGAWPSRPRSRRPDAARIERPENSTSSTSTTTASSIPPLGSSVRARPRAGRSRRSSRNMVMSSEPAGTCGALDLTDALRRVAVPGEHRA